MPLLAGVCVAPDMPPEPPGRTLYFSDILNADVVKSRVGADEVVERRVMFEVRVERLIINLGTLSFACLAS